MRLLGEGPGRFLPVISLDFFLSGRGTLGFALSPGLEEWPLFSGARVNVIGTGECIVAGKIGKSWLTRSLYRYAKPRPRRPTQSQSRWNAKAETVTD